MADTEHNDEVQETEAASPVAESAAEAAEAVSDETPAVGSETAEATAAAAEDAAAESEPVAAEPVARDSAAEPPSTAAAIKVSEPAPAPAAPDKGPVKAKLKELKALRDKALESGDAAALKRARTRMRRLKRRLRKAG